MTSNIISIDETGIVVLRIDCTFWQLVVPICTQLIWESDEPGNLNILGNLFGSQHQIDCSEELMMDGYPDQPFNRVIGWTNNRGIDRLCDQSDWLDNTRTICQSDWLDNTRTICQSDWLDNTRTIGQSDMSDWFDHTPNHIQLTATPSDQKL